MIPASSNAAWRSKIHPKLHLFPLGRRLRYPRLTPTRPPLSEHKTLLIFRYLRVLSAASIYRDASDLIHYINRDLLSLTDRSGVALGEPLVVIGIREGWCDSAGFGSGEPTDGRLTIGCDKPGMETALPAAPSPRHDRSTRCARSSISQRRSALTRKWPKSQPGSRRLRNPQTR